MHRRYFHINYQHEICLYFAHDTLARKVRWRQLACPQPQSYASSTPTQNSNIAGLHNAKALHCTLEFTSELLVSEAKMQCLYIAIVSCLSQRSVLYLLIIPNFFAKKIIKNNKSYHIGCVYFYPHVISNYICIPRIIKKHRLLHY